MDGYYLFNIGQNYEAYKCLGSFAETREGRRGFRFAVWAPNAARVALCGDFNGWDARGWELNLNPHNGIWEGFFRGLERWQRYKYEITGADGRTVLKADPFARHQETRPGTASILYDEKDYKWRDADWMRRRPHARANVPLNIYEMHIGSWRRYPDGSVYSYRELAEQLVPYLLEMGYNAVEFMPVMEYPLDDSWGYQVSGYFSVTSRYGTPDDFKYLMDCLHQAGIRVIIDWVPAHFPKDEFALARFDGTPLYEYADPDMGEHREWGTLVFDYGKKEVVSFLLSSAWFWINEMHADGLRVDAVTSMLYLNYGRSDEKLRNREGGLHNLDAIEFFRYLNSIVARYFPSVMMIAEESTAYPYMTKVVEEGGLGFTHKWNMGWMHDTLDYMSMDYIMRKGDHNRLTFSMTYAFTERFILALSHDEVVHGKKSLLDKMPGDIWRKFASLRSLLMYQMGHPGAKLNFMGYEIGQFIEWRFKEELEWFLLDFDLHSQLHAFVCELNHLYLEQSCLWELDDSWEGFSWNQVNDAANSVYAFTRRNHVGQQLLCIYNLTPATIPVYRLNAPAFGRYRILLNSDELRFGGSGNRSDYVKDAVLHTLVPDREAAVREMAAREQEIAGQSQALENQRQALCESAEAYRRSLSELREAGQVDASVALKVEEELARLSQFAPLSLSAAELKPELELALPPLSAMFLLHEEEESPVD